jgi:osmotically-inducible protein OsmY
MKKIQLSRKLVLTGGLLLTAFLSVNLQGCVILAAAGAGAATTAVVVHDKRPIQTIADDQNIELTATHKVGENTNWSQNSHIVTVAFNHAVLLVGQVPDQNTRSQVETMVQSLPKVTRIYNQLETSSPTTTDVRANDTWITTKVKSEMLATKDLHSIQIKVVTENSTVYLLGMVNHHQAQMAEDVARRVSGVNRVVTLFEYTME